MNGTEFIECVLVPLTEFCDPKGSKPHERRVVVHFGNATIHNVEVVEEHLADLGFTRMERPPYSPDPAPCSFFLFGAMKRNISAQRFKSVEELFFPVDALLGGISTDFLQTVLLEWERQL
jgi:transposase